MVGREVWGARSFDPRGLGFKSRRGMISFWSTSLVPAYPTVLSHGRILASFFLYRYVGTLLLTRYSMYSALQVPATTYEFLSGTYRRFSAVSTRQNFKKTRKADVK